MTPTSTSRVDLHCHSTASAVSKLGVQRALGLPECATPPQEVYDLAKRRGMSFVTITDHDTIDGALELAERYDDAFVSEELTAWFRGEPQAVHILVWGITPDDHERLQALAGDVEAVAEELVRRQITCALAHPFYAVEAPLLPRHRRRLAQLFPIWETRNGSRAPELNSPAEVYIETHGGTGVGGSDDHAGVDIGRTFTQTPECVTWRAFLDHVARGAATPLGEHGSAAKWTHAAMALATRALGRGARDGAAPDPAAIFTMVQRLMREGDARSSHTETGLCPDDARALLRAWLAAVELDLEESELIAFLQREDFFHADLYRRAKRVHERKLARTVNAIAASTPESADLPATASALFEACLAAIPYAPAAAFLGREKSKLARREGEPLRVALVADAVGGMHGVTHTLDELRERGVPGFEVEVVGTDHNVDRRLSAVAEIDIPFYAGLKVGVPSLPAIVEALADGRYDLVHLCSPGPSGAAAALIARAMGVPILGSYHTELAAYAGLRTQDPQLELAARIAIGAFYGQCRRVLSPSTASDAVLRQMGIADERIGRWDRGVDIARFSPARRQAGPAARRDHGALRRTARRTRRAPTCSPTRSCRRGRAIRACTSRWPAADPRRSGCARASASTRRSSAGWRATRWRPPTRAPTCSSSPAARTRSARSCSRPRRAGCRSSPSARAARRASSPTRSPAACAAPTRASWPTRSSTSPTRRSGARSWRATRCAPSRTAPGSARCNASPTATAARSIPPPRHVSSAVPREAAVLAAGRRLRTGDPARRAPRPPREAPLRVADVALFYGERSGGIRTYLDAKAAWAQAGELIEHHVIVPGRVERHEGGRHELPSLRLAATNGYRMPLGAGALKDTLRELRPDIVALHDPFWRPLGVTQTAHELGAKVVAVHHGSIALDAAGLPGPDAALASAAALVDAPRVPRRRRDHVGRRPARGLRARRGDPAALRHRAGLRAPAVRAPPGPRAVRRAPRAREGRHRAAARRRALAASRGSSSSSGAVRSRTACGASRSGWGSPTACGCTRSSPSASGWRAGTRARASSSCPARTRPSASPASRRRRPAFPSWPARPRRRSR